MKIITRHSQSGFAIFIVLISIAALSAMAFAFAYNMKVETKLAMNSNNETEMEWLARSAVEKARWVLAEEMLQPGSAQHYDALNQKWSGGTGETNGLLSSIDLSVEFPYGKAVFKITDNERKFNINNAVNNEALMTQALILIGVDASEIPTIIASIQDWIDVDDETHVNGAESEYYQTLDPPYFAKNGPVDDLSELLFVKGITPDIYWGPNSTNHPPTIFQKNQTVTRSGSQPNAPIISAGLVDVFTPVSSGSVNINTASSTTLRMLGMDESTVARLINMRAGPDGVDGTEDDVPFSSPGEIINAGIPQQLAQQFMSLLTVRSSTFEVQVDVEVGMSKRRYYAIVRRNSPKDIPILSLRWE